MKKRLRLWSVFFSALMLLTFMAGCQSEGQPVEKETTRGNQPEQSEQTTQPKQPEQPEQPTPPEDLNVIVPPVFETGELGLVEKEDLYPDFRESETWTERTEQASVIAVEAEAYESTTLHFAKMYGSEFGGGILMQALTEQAPAQGWDSVYEVTYLVSAPRAGAYRLTALSSDLQKEYTSDYFVDVNGKRVLEAGKSYTVLENFNASFDPNLCKLMDLGEVELKEGENRISFVIDNVDSQNSWNRISFFFDYFKLTYVNPDTPTQPLSVSYAVQLTDQDAKALLAAAEVNVFDCRYPLSMRAMQRAAQAQEVGFTVTDYFGNVIFQSSKTADQEETLILEKTVKNHPTGYFLMTIGDQTYRYVVVSSFAEPMPEDSPFGMDYAAYYLIKDLDKVYEIACAARMAGVTWVRDRADWRTYEPMLGQYNFGATEQVWRAIDQAGLKNLAMLCSAPAWATEGLGAQGMAGGFANTQLEIYQMTKAMVTYYDGLVDAWELWNESDHGFALETAELYAAWYKAAALGVLDANPNALLSFGGLCQPDTNSDYMHMMFMNDVMKYSSIFNYHAHTPQGTSIPDFTRFAMVSGTNASLAHYNKANKPVWLTEAGMKIMTETPTEQLLHEQAPYIITSTVQSLTMGTDKHFWFVLAPYIEVGGDFGTFSKDFQPYPTLAAQSAMTHVLGKAQYLGELYDLPRQAYGYVFFTGSRAASVLWASKPTEYTFEAQQAVIVTDMMGAQTLIKPQDGKIVLTLGVDPIFVTYSQAPAYQSKQYPESAIKPVELGVGERVVLSPEFEGYDINDESTKLNGHIVSDGSKITLYVTNLNDKEVKGTVSATLAGFTVQGLENQITVPAKSRVGIELILVRNSDEKINDYIIFVGEFEGEQTSCSVAHVYTDAPERDVKVKFSSLKSGKEYGADVLQSIGIRMGSHEGEGVAYLNSMPLDTVRYDGTEIKIDLSALSLGKHTVVGGIQTPAGDLIFTVFYITYENDVVVFELP